MCLIHFEKTVLILKLLDWSGFIYLLYLLYTTCKYFKYFCVMGVKESESEVTQLCPTLWTPWTVTYQAPTSMGFSSQEHWSGLPFPFPGDLPNRGIEPRSPAL